MRRACELAERGRGSTAPNPCVGAVLVRGTQTLGEGFHRKRGEPHAEIEALRSASEAGHDVRGAMLYVTLEPCDHVGLTGACSRALIDAGLARVVIGTLDPNPTTAGNGAERLRDAELAVEVVDDPWARALVEDFSVSIGRTRPYLTLKMASSLDGFVAPSPGSHWLTGERARECVRELRVAHDAVMVGAGTVRSDDPLLTVRPPRARRKPYVRIVACERDPVPLQSHVFEPAEGYAPTIVLAPALARERFAPLEANARVMYVGEDRTLDLTLALEMLGADGLSTILCEGGPTLAGHLLGDGLVDRLVWLAAPRLFANPRALPVFGPGNVVDAARTLRVDRVERLGEDVMVSGRLGVPATEG